MSLFRVIDFWSESKNDVDSKENQFWKSLKRTLEDGPAGAFEQKLTV